MAETEVKSINGKPVADVTARARIEEIKNASPGLVFETVADMEAYIAENAGTLKVGQDLFIREADAPDYWWDGTKAVEVETDLSGVKEDIDKLSAEIANLQISGLTTAQVNALDGMFKIASFTEDPTEAYSAFKVAFGIEDSGEVEPDEPDTPTVTLTSISATYSGGDVAVGTSLADLTGIVVTATYSDGSTAAVTGYTLSGEIAEGSNTITVTYQGKTATFTVTGVVAVEPLYGVFWPPKGAVTNWNNHEWAGVENFAYTGNTGEYIDAGFPAAAFVRLDKLQGTVYIRSLAKSRFGYFSQAYQVYINNDGEIAAGGFTKLDGIYHGKSSEGGDIDYGSVTVGDETFYFVLAKFEIPTGKVGYFVSTHNFADAGGFITNEDNTAILEEYKPYYTMFTYDPSDRITEPATEVV